MKHRSNTRARFSLRRGQHRPEVIAEREALEQAARVQPTVIRLVSFAALTRGTR